MGAGAGYNVKGTIDYDSIKINSFEVGELSTKSEKVRGGPIVQYPTIPITCDIDCYAEDIYCESYMYGGTLYGPTPIKITKMVLVPQYDDIEDIPEIDESTIKDALYELAFDVSLGAGWIHSTFTGDISCSTYELKEYGYPDFEFDEISMRITNKQAVEVIDEYVCGDNYSDEYKVVDIDGIELEYFEDFDDAVEWAKENNGYQVWGSRIWYDYYITNSGDVESDVRDFDDDIGKDWTNPDYIDED